MNVSTLARHLFYNLCIIFFVGCSLEAHLSRSSTAVSQIETLKFDLNNLDVSGLHWKVFGTENSPGGELQINLNMEEYLYKNKVKFVNLPEGAELQCSGTQSNLALQTLDLGTTKTFTMKVNYWMSLDQEWADNEDQSFDCWYELAGKKSQTIMFKVALKESKIVRVSVPSYSGEVLGGSRGGKISDDGKFIVFTSTQDGVATGDLNGSEDIFIMERLTGKITLVSKTSTGKSGNGSSYAPSISSDGRYVAFMSDSSDLVAGDVNGFSDIFIHDRQSGVASLVSVSSSGVQGDGESYSPSISSDGRYVVFGSRASNLVAGDTNGKGDVFIHDRQTGATNLVSVSSAGVRGDDDSDSPVVSSDGRYVAFLSGASNLVVSDTNGSSDIFVHDRQTGLTNRVSVDSSGGQGNSYSNYPSISSDGRYVAFCSFSALVPGDSNFNMDAFVHDRQTGVTSRVSVGSSGTQGASNSQESSISSDGRYVVFYSHANNLVSGDTNTESDVFVHDRETGQTNRVSIDSSGIQGNGASYSPSISADGRYVAFVSYASNFSAGDSGESEDVFFHDRQTGVTSQGSTLVPGVEGNYSSYSASLSANGRYVAFESWAENLVVGDVNSMEDIFIHDRQSGATSLVSVSSSGVQGNNSSYSPSISSDGRYVVFESHANNLILGDTNGSSDIFIRDRQTGSTSRISVDSAGIEGNSSSKKPSISSDGRYIAFLSHASNLVSGDTNGVIDVFVHDRDTGVTSRVSVDSSGIQGNANMFNPNISPDGRYVAFNSMSSNLVPGDTNGVSDIFVHDRQTGLTSRVSVDSSGIQGSDFSAYPSLSGDGRYVTFYSDSTNLVSGDTNGKSDIFIHDRQTGVTSRISVSSSGTQANDNASDPVISADGRYVAFVSSATNLVSGTTNGTENVFVYDRQTETTRLISVGAAGSQADSNSGDLAITPDGRYVAFYSNATNLIPGDQNWTDDIFVVRNK